MIKVPDKWHRMLMELQVYSPSAVLAGGAIRDLICGKPVRDLDFWIKHWTEPQIPPVYMEHWGRVISLDRYQSIRGNTHTTAGHVWEIKPYSWLPARWQTMVNIIWTSKWKSTLELVEEFDFGICMVAYDGKEIIRSRHFDHDYENKVFSLRRAVDPKMTRKAVRRYEAKFKRKYGWPMELSGQARLDQMLAGLHRAGALHPQEQ